MSAGLFPEGTASSQRILRDVPLSNTTRCYPRSLSQAFPDMRATCIEVHRPVTPLGHRVVLWLSSFVLFVMLLALALGY
jgi:hypothetical protein